MDGAGDVNGDGYDDGIIGANQADPHGANEGKSYAVYGGSNLASSTPGAPLLDSDRR